MATALTNPSIVGVATQSVAATLANHLVRKGELDTALADKVDTDDARLSDAREPNGAAGGDLEGDFPNPTLKEVATAGTFTKVTIDAKGRVTAGTTLSASDVPAHASRHAAAGTDPLLLSDLGLPAASVSMNSQKITNLGSPAAGTDAATKGYVDARRLNEAALPTAPVDLNNYKLVNVAEPAGAQDAATKAYVDARKLSQLAAPTANVDFNGYEAVGVADPTTNQSAATKAYVDARRLDQLAAPTSSVSLNSQRLTSVADPVSDSDAATKAYVDAKARGHSTKPACRVATTENIALSGLLTIDGVALNEGDRVLVKDQDVPSQNGLYAAAAGAWTRVEDADTSAEVKSGLTTFVSEGDTQANNAYTLITADPITLDTTDLEFTQTSGAGQVIAGTGLSKAGNALSVDYGTSASTACRGDDARLSNARVPSGAAGGDLDGTFPNPTLKEVATAGTFTKVTIDAKGRVTSGTTLSASDLPAHASRHKAAGVDPILLNELGLPNASVDANAQKIVNLANASDGGDAVNLTTLAAQLALRHQKAPCRLATTANHSLSGLAAIDSVTPNSGDRILVKSQADTKQNGIYVAAAGAWARASDADSSAEVTSGLTVFVSEGTLNGGKRYALTTADPITLNTTLLTFTQVSGAGQVTAGTALAKSGDTLSVVLGTTSNSACAGNDARLSDARQPAALAADMDANNKKIIQLAEPTSSSDAATKLYVDEHVINTFPIDGPLDVDSQKITSLGTPTDATDAATKGYVDARRLDQVAAPTSSVSLNSQKIVNLATPTAATDAANKAYVDSVAYGMDPKASCRLATTGNHALSGLAAIDGVTPVAGDRILVKSQTDAKQNGIYVAAAGAWARAADCDADAEVTSGLFTFVSEGTANAGNGYTLTTADPIVVGTTSLTFTQTSAAGVLTAGTGLSKSGNILSIDFATKLSAFAAPDADISLSSHKLTNVTDPASAQDAATKAYVDGRKLHDFTAPTASVSLNSQKITSLADPTANQDAATKLYVDNGDRTGNVVWVDAVNGNDGTGARGKASLPFLTLGAAKAAASSGDTVIVLPGTYNERNLLKNGVNWHFLPGAQIVYTGAAAGAIWDDSGYGANAAVVCSITGYGVFKNNGTDSQAFAVFFVHPSSEITFECQEIVSDLRSCVAVSCLKSRIKCRRIASQTNPAYTVTSGEHTLDCTEITAANDSAVVITSGTVVLKADRIESAANAAVYVHSASPIVAALTAREIKATGGYGLHVHYDESADPIVTVNGARIVSTLGTSAGVAVYCQNAQNLTLKDCVLVSSGSALESITSPAACNVRLYGSCMANMDKGVDITFITGATRFEFDGNVV